jgi:tetratricopeptide (TPR) repeat protein
MSACKISAMFSRRDRRSILSQMKSMRWKLALLFLLVPALPLRSQVRVWEGVLDLPVYEEGAPDANPSFDQFATDRFSYPYTLRKQTTAQRRQHQLRAIYLENEYLKCSVLPDIGGHVYTCIDKISGQAMFYANPSIKKANIGYRGAWAAFGIEFNFPVSHNWMSMSPVDFAYAAYEDGSASVTIGNIDRVYGMEWSVELILRPGSTVLEQRVRLSNRSDVRQRFYWWNNAAVQVWDDSRIEYPMRYAAAHGFAEVQRWPVDAQGKDLSIIKNQTDGPVSLFVHGSREDFMGIWHPHTNAGTAHYARYNELPAKKIWSWGVDADGLDWRKALSDDNSAYAEVQAGLFRNQETYAFLEPRQHISFSEYWMPVRGTGGISRANLAGVVHLERKDDSLVISLNTNQKLPAATLQVLDGSALLLSDTVDLTPETTWTKAVHGPSKERNYTFELKDSKGAVLLRQTEGQYDWAADSEVKIGPQSNYVLPDEDGRTGDDWLQAGKAKELNGDKLSAQETYEKALRKFPASFELLKASGRLATSLKRFEEAVPRLAAAHERNTTDGEISYYLGIAQEGAGREKDAIDAYEAAMRSPEHRGGAALRLAELKAVQGKLEEARDFLAESLKSVPDDLRTREDLVAIAGAMGQTQEATKQAKDLLRRFPLSAFLREEAGDPDLAHLAADPYRVLNVAGQYARLGLYQKALKVLSRNYPSVLADQVEPGIGLPQDNPLVVYFRGYCREKLHASGSEDYTQASRLSTLYVFPNTLEDKMALDAALRWNPEDATAHHLLGTWYFARAMTGEALREWDASRRLNPKIPALDASLGLALLHEVRDFAGALSVFEDGIKNDPENIVNYSGAVTTMALLGRSADARVKTLERYADLKQLPTSLVYELALNRAEARDFSGAIALFHDRFFGREEGGTNVRQVWIEVKLQQVLQLEKSGHCAEALAEAKALGLPVSGLAFTRDGLAPILNSPRTNYLLAEVYAACGQRTEAAAKFEQVSAATESSDLVWAWEAAKSQGGYDLTKWMDRLKGGILQAEANSRLSASPGWWIYTAGVLRIAVGQKEQGQAELREVFLLPESKMCHHLSRLVFAEAALR